jgi:hypothetical protein
MPRASKSPALSKKPTRMSARKFSATKVVGFRRGDSYQSARMPKAVEKDRVRLFVNVVAAVKEENELLQIWFDFEEFKSAVYGVGK